MAAGEPPASSCGLTGTPNCPLALAPDSPPFLPDAADGSCLTVPSEGSSYSPVTATRARLRTTAFRNILGSSLGWESLLLHQILPGFRGETETRFPQGLKSGLSFEVPRLMNPSMLERLVRGHAKRGLPATHQQSPGPVRVLFPFLIMKYSQRPQKEPK